MNTPDHNIHVRSFLTDNIMVYVEGDGQPDTNTTGALWALIAKAVVTSEVQERLDKAAPPAQFIGHIVWESRHFFLHDYTLAFAWQLHNSMHNEIKAAIANGKLMPIDKVPRKIKQGKE